MQVPRRDYKPINWIGDTRRELRSMPTEVQDDVGYALYEAQIGLKSDKAKPLTGFGGAGVLEVVSVFDGNAFRAIYTVRFAMRIYVLHVFQKKSKRGIAKPRSEIDLIRKRLKTAEEAHAQWPEQQKG